MNILFLTDYFYPIGSPSANCAKDVAKALKKDGNEIYFLAFKGCKEKKVVQEFEVKKIFPRFSLVLRELSQSIDNQTLKILIYKVSIIIHRIKRVLMLHTYPLMSYTFLKKYERETFKIIDKKNIDLIIGIYNPVESFFVIKKIKEKKKDIPCIIYAFDSMSNVEGTKLMNTSERNIRGWMMEKKLFKYPNKIFFMECHKKFYQQKRYDIYKDKIDFLDIPLYVPEIYQQLRVQAAIEKIPKRILYAGSLDYEKRNPQKLLNILETMILKDKAITVYFYINLTCYDLLKQYQKKYPHNFFVFQFIDDEKLRIEEIKSDLLLSLGVNSDAISSKIFRYFSTGNKSVHLYNYEKEPVLQYYEKYSNGMCIDESLETKVIADIIINFLNKPDRPIDENQFVKNRPEYAAKRFENI